MLSMNYSILCMHGGVDSSRPMVTNCRTINNFAVVACCSVTDNNAQYNELKNIDFIINNCVN